MISHPGRKDLSKLDRVRTLIVGPKVERTVAQVTRMLESRSNISIVGNWNGKEKIEKKIPKIVDLVFIVIEYCATTTKEFILRQCREQGIAYIIGQESFSTLDLGKLGIKLKKRPGRVPKLPSGKKDGEKQPAVPEPAPAPEPIIDTAAPVIPAVPSAPEPPVIDEAEMRLRSEIYSIFGPLQMLLKAQTGTTRSFLVEVYADSLDIVFSASEKTSKK